MIRLLIGLYSKFAFIRSDRMKRNSFVVTLASLAMLVTASAVQAAPPSSAFSGSWIGIDPVDGSTEYLVVNGGSNARIDYQDSYAQACWDAGSTDYWFSSDLRGDVSDITMSGVFKSAKCGHVQLSGMKGLSMVWTFSPGATADPADDTLFDTTVTWSRV
jgi:hypothetical protein